MIINNRYCLLSLLTGDMTSTQFENLNNHKKLILATKGKKK